MDLLNLGCGARFHPEWVNVDLVSATPAVLAHDIRRPLPFQDESFDAVYHSHVLEHLPPTDGHALLSECQRVLRPGGVVRVVVPDLEAIARAYLAALERVDRGDPRAAADHDWMTIELLDQLVRVESGGQMKRWLSDSNLPNQSFVERRIGNEITGLGGTPRQFGNRAARRSVRSPMARLKKLAGRVRRTLSRTAVGVLEGSQARAAYQESAFRQSGEVHRWMYDRLSLGRLLEATGFGQVEVVSADKSGIPEFASFELDSIAGQVRKPDSLFMEGIRPSIPSQAAATDLVRSATNCS